MQFNQLVKSLLEEYDIEEIQRTNDREFRYYENVLYRIGDHTCVAHVDEVTHTMENTFYSDHISKYEEYIQNGGAVDTFPVNIIASEEMSLPDYMDWLMESDDENFETAWKLAEKLGMKYFDLQHKLEYIMHDGEVTEWDAETKKSVKVDIEMSEEEIEDLSDDIQAYLKSDQDIEIEYNLREMNHRFAAVKNLGIQHVLVEPLSAEDIKVANDHNLMI